MRNQFRIQWNAYFYQYSLLSISKQLMPSRTFNWMTFWANERKLVAPIIESSSSYFDKMAHIHALGYECDNEDYDVIDSEEEENIVLSRLSSLQANECLRG